MAAFSASNVVFPNRTLTSFLTFFPFSKLPKQQYHHRPSSSSSSSSLHHHHHPHRRITISASSSVVNTVSDVQLQDSNEDFLATTTTSTSSWSEFAKNVSGEWDGYGADFTKEGKPIELPEYVVPEAFREWEVKVFDWQTQCPTLAQPDHHHLLASKLIKLLPTVGCEADAATRYSVDERNIGGGADSKVFAFAYQSSSGSYVALWPMEEDDQYNNKDTVQLLELEHCLVDPRNRESRVRIIQVVLLDGSKMALRNIKVFCEQYYGPFRNGEQLGGCAIRDSAFASTDALKSSQLTGFWQARNSIARFQTNLIEELVDDDSVQNFLRDDGDLILLPKQLWCSLRETEDGEKCSEVGWLFDEGRAITSRCIFSSDSKLKEIAVANESAALEGL